MDANSTQLMVGEIKAGWGTFMDDATASAWRREIAPLSWADADKILKKMMDAGVKPTLSEFRKRHKEARADGYRAKVEHVQHEHCDVCGSRGYLALILAGERYDKPERIADSRDTCPATMMKAYWQHRIPCIACSLGKAYANRWHQTLVQDQNRWEQYARRAFKLCQAQYMEEFYQACADNKWTGRPIPDRFYPDRQSEESQKLTADLSVILQRTLEYMQTQECHQ